jgi:hypothetical protein
VEHRDAIPNNRKIPGSDSMSYENWRQLDPELVPFMVKEFSETITSGEFDPQWFRFYIKVSAQEAWTTRGETNLAVE